MNRIHTHYLRVLSNTWVNDFSSLKHEKEIDDFEIALNIVSGSGKEHMAILAAVLKLGLAIRFITFENNKVIEL